jgi:hypothetical protein
VEAGLLGQLGEEVGVHRGLSVDGCFSTVDFGLSASYPLNTAIAGESTI